MRHPATKITTQQIAQVPLFQGAAAEQLEAIAHSAHELALGRGEVLFNKGDPSKGFYYVVDGQVKLAFLAEDGGEKVLEIISAGMEFGEGVMFLERPFPVYAQATRDTRLLFIPREPVVAQALAQPRFALGMISALAMRLHRIVRDVEDLTLHGSSQRVIGYLLRDDPGKCPESGPYELELPASKGLIASRLNLTPETFSRVLNHLSAEGLIQVRGRSIRIQDVQRLARFGH